MGTGGSSTNLVTRLIAPSAGSELTLYTTYLRIYDQRGGEHADAQVYEYA